MSESWFVFIGNSVIKTGTRYKLVRKLNSFGENFIAILFN